MYVGTLGSVGSEEAHVHTLVIYDGSFAYLFARQARTGQPTWATRRALIQDTDPQVAYGASISTQRPHVRGDAQVPRHRRTT